jgi:four helix bundle protein
VPHDPNKLSVFRRSHSLALDIYRLTRLLPADEKRGLTAQLRRAVTSIPTNIVEGCVRTSIREYRHFISIALGSAAEAHYLLGLIVDLGYLSSNDAFDCRECTDHVVGELQNLLRAISGFDS